MQKVLKSEDPRRGRSGSCCSTGVFRGVVVSAEIVGTVVELDELEGAVGVCVDPVGLELLLAHRPAADAVGVGFVGLGGRVDDRFLELEGDDLTLVDGGEADGLKGPQLFTDDDDDLRLLRLLLGQVRGDVEVGLS